MLGKRRGKYTGAAVTVCSAFHYDVFPIFPGFTYYSGAYEITRFFTGKIVPI